MAIGAGGLGYDSGVSRIGHSVANGSPPLLRSCVAQRLSRRDEPHHSLHASAKHREHSEDFFYFFGIYKQKNHLLSPAAPLTCEFFAWR